LETHCDALTGIGRGGGSEAFRAIPSAEPAIGAGAGVDAGAGIAARGCSASDTVRAAIGVARTG
jgi:hypothetical protein